MDPEDDVIVVDDPAPEVDNSETTIEAPDAVVDASPTIIVETGDGDDGASDAEIDRAVETAERLTALEGVVGTLVNEVSEVRAQANQAVAVAEIAIEETADMAEAVEPMAEAVAETVAEDLDLDTDDNPDTPPSTSGRHWFFRTWKEWKNR